MQSRDKLEIVPVASPSRPVALRLGCALAVLLALPSLMLAQATPPPPDPPAAQKPPAHKPSATEQFPYPGDSTPPASTPPPGAPSDNSTPDAPAPITRQSPAAPAAAKQFPYPGDSPAPDPGSSSSSSSSSAGADPDSATEADPDNSPSSGVKQTPRRKLPKPKSLQTDDEREAEDLTVARFYRDRGNWNAAYQRSKDAVQHQTDDPDAHLLLAETAEKLNKREEAIAEYKAILTLDSSNSQLKAARKALARLQ